MRRLIQTAIGRMAILSFSLALIAGAIWASQSPPHYWLENEYFITVKPAPQFDSSSEFFRSRLVTHLSTPFGIRPGDDRIAIGQAQVDNQRLAYSDFVKNCGDPLGSTPNKIIATSRTSYLCNSANLTGEIARFAVIEFHRKVDEEVATYRLQVVANTGKRIGEALLVAFALTALAAASMWVVKGKLG